MPSLTVIIVVLLVVIALFVLGKLLKRGTAIERPKIENLDVYMKKLAEEAVDLSKEYNLALDYTINSIEKAEIILGKIHEDFIRQKPKEGVDGLAMAFGAYIGETIKRNSSGAYWEQDHPVGGPNSFPLHWEGGESFTPAWCFRRITIGPEDNVWHKYQVLAEQRNTTN